MRQAARSQLQHAGCTAGAVTGMFSGVVKCPALPGS